MKKYLQISIKLHLIIFVFVVVTLSTVIFGSNNRTYAAPVVGFNPGNIIDDFVFTNTNTMNASQIQDFLNSKVPVCDTNGTQQSEFGGGTRAQWGATHYNQTVFTCLKDYSIGGKSAAQIIYDAAQESQINPQVLLVLLQKEQALVTDTWPLDIQYRSATGYGCPDTSACDSQYYGLVNQVRWSARMFRAIMNASPTWYTPYVLGDNFIRWSPNSSCGGSIVTIQNRATQGLYNYTPYQPNASALNAGYGLGDPCGAYGNRNFYLYFTDWFGSARANDTYQRHPDGTLINIDNAVYIIDEGVLHHILNGTVFETNSYRWGDIKQATTGDKQLTKSSVIDYIKPGILYRGATTGVFRTVSESGKWVKQPISYNSFISLGYNWQQVRLVPDSDLPVDNSTSVYFLNRHPDGTLINDNGSVYVLDNGTRRYVSSLVFNSYNWSWNSIVNATIDDNSLPLGSKMVLREGIVVSNSNNLYVVKLAAQTSETIKPIGPWECYSNIFKYVTSDAIPVSNLELPQQIGTRISC